LPEALRHLLEGQRPDDGDNLGLWLDKLVRVDDETWKLEADARERELDRLFCPRERNVPRAWQSDAARHAVTRLREACADVHGEAHRSFVVEVHGRLLVDYGRVSSLESSVSLHPVLGCPRIPGSALKGLLYSWLRDRSELSMHELFGEPKEGKDGKVTFRRGRLVLYDALPEEGRFQLAMDVLTPHAGKYYLGNESPADWLSPVPFTFLTVVKTGFRVFMGLLPKGKECGTSQLDPLEEALCEALEIEGIGAKRAAGYGRLRKPKGER